MNLSMTKRRSIRAIASTSMTALLAVGILFAGAVPAQAADWKKVSSRNYCYVVSGWNDCYTETTYRRTSAFCEKPAGNLTGGLAAWYSYCYKTVTVRK